jgi:hypothetical protein
MVILRRTVLRVQGKNAAVPGYSEAAASRIKDVFECVDRETGQAVWLCYFVTGP